MKRCQDVAQGDELQQVAARRADEQQVGALLDGVRRHHGHTASPAAPVCGDHDRTARAGLAIRLGARPAILVRRPSPAGRAPPTIQAMDDYRAIDAHAPAPAPRRHRGRRPDAQPRAPAAASASRTSSSGRRDATREIVIWDNALDRRDRRDYLEHARRSAHPRRPQRGEHRPERATRAPSRLTTAPYLVELDDDVVDAPADWDATLLDAFKRLPTIGFLAADLEDDPHDLASPLPASHPAARVHARRGERRSAARTARPAAAAR